MEFRNSRIIGLKARPGTDDDDDEGETNPTLGWFEHIPKFLRREGIRQF